MNALNILQALTAVMAILQEASEAIAQYRTLVERARTENRDITDAELDQLRTVRDAALAELRARLGA